MNRILIIASLVVAAYPAAAIAQTRGEVTARNIFEDSGSRALLEEVARSNRDEPRLFYAVNRATAFASPDSTHPYVTLDAREPVHMVSRSGPWVEISTVDGAHGFVREEVLSNVWIRVSKTSRTVWVHRGPDVAATIPADMAYNFFLNKERRGSSAQPDHWRTPEGLYYVVSKKDDSRFHKAFVLNYPTRRDGESGLEQGLISRAQFDAIAEADSQFTMPPMDTPLGGWIEIHGMGTGSRIMWTRGCVAIPNESIDALWEVVHVGTPVLIES